MKRKIPSVVHSCNEVNNIFPTFCFKVKVSNDTDYRIFVI